MKFLTEHNAAPSDDAISQVPDDIQDYINDLYQDLIDAESVIEILGAAANKLWDALESQPLHGLMSEDVYEIEKLLQETGKVLNS